MPDIALRTYLEEIDGMIDGSRVEEAIAHLKHILGIYPKNLDAYRLLAKGLLEKNKHLDAADVFQRVLSSVPDDFIAHVGMAVVREDEGNLDAAIWHMERAYEVQPSNGPVQEELRRLYGKRDGGEPPRLRLSRAALARMYEKGSLYPQAIAEARSALTEDPDRLDLKVLLATSLWRMRQRAEAAEASAKLLEVLPYCREANRILAHVWDEEGHPAEAQNYKRRLEALDPYEAFSDPSHNGTGSSHVPSEQVQVPRLENVYGETTTDANRPDWMEALGIQYDQTTPTSAPETEDWMNVISPPGSDSSASAPAASPDLPGTGWLDAIRGTGPLTPPTAPGASTTMPQADVPDWMRPSVAEPSPSANAAPDWMAGLAPADESPSEQPQEKAVVGGTDWLSDLFGVQGGGPAAPPADAAPEAPVAAQEAPPPVPGDVEPPTESTGMTGWLTALQEDAHIPTDSVPTASAPVASNEDDEVPEWLHAAANVDESLPTRASDVPDWIRTSAAAVDSDRTDQGLPDWLGGSEDADAEEPPQPISHVDAQAVAPAAPSGDLPDWLQTLPPAEEEPSPTSAPDWMSPTDDTRVSTPRRAEPADRRPEAADRRPEVEAAAPPPSDDLPAWLTEHEPVEASSADERPDAADRRPEAADVPEWLNTSTAEAAPANELPAWLRSSAVEETSTYEASTPAVPAPEDIPSWLRLQPDAEEETTSEVPDWLRPAAPAEAEEEPTTEPAMSAEQKAAIMEQAAEEIPAWMADAGWAPRDPTIPLDSAANLVEPEAEADAETPLAEEGEPEPAELPDWLRAMKPAEDSQPAPASKAAASRPAADAPDWLRAAMEGKAPAEASAAPVEPTPPARQVTAADLPEWLQTASNDPGETIVAFLKNKPKTSALPPLPDDYKAPDAPAIPDWLKTRAQPPKADIKTSPFESISETGPLETVPEPVAAEVPPLDAADPNNMTADEALAWLENLAARQGANEEELVTKRAELPWLREPAEAESGPLQPASAAPPVAEEVDISSLIADTKPLSANRQSEPAYRQPEAAEPAEALPDWLRVPDEPTEAQSTPAWLRSAMEEPAETPAPVAAEPEAEALPSINTDDDAIAWLESLAAKQGASTDELVTRPEQRLDELPDWLREPEPLSEEAHQVVTEPLKPIAEVPVVEEALPPFEMEAISSPEPAEVQAEAQADVSAATMSDDEALAWLESLAVKQGANAEELVSQPASRPDTSAGSALPDWLKTQMEAVESIEPVIPAVEEPAALQAEPTAGDGVTPVEPVEPQPAWLTEMEAESDQYEATLQTEPEPPAAPAAAEMSEDAALAWLESLAVKHGAATEELVSKPEARSEEMPEWVRAEAAAIEAEPEPEPAVAEVPEPEPAVVVPEKPAWLQQMEAESDVYEATLHAEPEANVVSEPAVASVPEATEPPAWLAELAAEETEPQPIAELETLWTPPAAPQLEPAAPKPAAVEPKMPAWLAEEPVAQPPEPPAWIPAAAAPSIAKAVAPEPTSEEPAPKPKPARKPKPKSASRPPRKRAGVAKPSKLRRTEAPELVLALARERLTDEKMGEAVEVYSELIASNHLIGDIIADLEAATLKRPDQPELLRTLGDAYMHDNQLQRALDAYRQALKKL